MNSTASQTRFLSRLWSVSWPTVLYSLLETTVAFVDIYLVSFIGSEAVAAIGFSRQIYLVLMIGTLSITTGTITLVSQHYGARQYSFASSVASHSLLLSVIAGVVIGSIGVLFSEPSLWLLGARGEAFLEGTAYLKVLMGGAIFLMINFTGNGVFRALGDTLSPLYMATLVNVLNILFSYILIFGAGPVPAFGVMGAAMGTVLARAIGAVIAIWVLSRRSRRVRISIRNGFRLTAMRQILHIGLPSGFSGFFRNGARILFFRILATTAAGSIAVAVATIGFQIRMFIIMPALAFQVATATLVGQSIGARRIDEAEKYGWTAIKFCCTIMALASLWVFFFPAFIMRQFTYSDQVIDMGCWALRFIALEQFCNCVSIIISGVLSGAGDTRPSMQYTILSQWLLMLPLAYLLAESRWEVHGAWIAWGIAPIVQAYLTFQRFLKGIWKTMRVTGTVAGFADE